MLSDVLEITKEEIVDKNKMEGVKARTPFENQQFYLISPGDKIEIETAGTSKHMKFSIFEKKSKSPIFKARALSANFENKPENLLHAFFECINQLPVSQSRPLAKRAIFLRKAGQKINTIFYFITHPQVFS